MCGIAGYLNLNGKPADDRVLRRMARAIAHRGPDGEGVFTDGALGFAHRRLAIIDLTEAAAQPMESSDGRFVLSYNGEVYNYRELRAQLEGKGMRFRSTSDTEVVLAAFEAWGDDALKRFNGMFALSLWDRKTKRLVLARDRFGVKPLYFCETGSSFLFGSEIKAILAHGALGAALDPAALAEYLGFQNFFTTNTLFKSVRTLQPGTILVHENGKCRQLRYWDYDFSEPEQPLPKGELVEKLGELFERAVSRQLVSDVPVGTYLSGGMDTGAITALAAQSMPHLCSFTIGFDLTSASGLELGFDERQTAERMSYLFKTEHYEMVLKAGDMERVMPSLVWHLEEPRVGQSYPNFYAAKLASRFGKVVLSGAGGDELFAGYPWRYYRAAGAADFDSYVDTYFDFWQRMVSTEEHRALLAPLGASACVDLKQIFRDVFTEKADQLTRPEDYVNHSLNFEARTFLHGILTVEDKLSMAHGLESRVPFLDNDLVDFAMHDVPVRTKLGHLDAAIRLDENEPGAKTQRYFQKTRDGKLILRELMQRYLPEDIAGGLKQGFSAPDASWFRGESIDYVRRTLLDRNAAIFTFLDRKTVEQIVSRHLSGSENRRLFIWSLLYLESWCQKFLGASSVVTDEVMA